MVAHLTERLGEGVVVRSDDIDGNDVIGTVTAPDGTVYDYRASCTDDGEVVESTLTNRR